MFVVLESKQLKPCDRDLSMSKDMRDWPRANLGAAAKCSEPVLSTIENPRRAFAVPGPEMLERPRQTLSPSAVPSSPVASRWPPGGLLASRRAACTAVEVPKPEQEKRGRSKVWIIGGTNERGRKPRRLPMFGSRDTT